MDLNLVWAAGFFDGEGSISIQVTRGYKYLTLSIGQTDRRPLERFMEAVGGGHIVGPYTHKTKNWKPVYHWQTSKDSRSIYAKIEPYLSAPKREQYQRVTERFTVG